MQEHIMNRLLSPGLVMLAGVAFGVAAISGLNAQGKPQTYVVIDITELTNPEGFTAVTANPATSPTRLAALGGRYIIRTEAMTPLDGTPPKRFILLAFDSKEKARAWYDAPDIKEVNAIRAKTTKSYSFIAEGFAY
jgi:uncharacterized protein (DUF1330 family)